MAPEKYDDSYRIVKFRLLASHPNILLYSVADPGIVKRRWNYLAKLSQLSSTSEDMATSRCEHSIEKWLNNIFKFQLYNI